MDKAQFIEMVSREQESLRRFLCVLCRGDAFRADDIAQEALLKAYLSFGKFEGRAKFSTWLFRIAYNCFYDNMTAGKETEGEPLGPQQEKIAGEEGPSVRGFEYQELYQAIGDLPEKEQAVILLFYMEEKSIKEIEAITGMPSGTVRSHLSRAREHLRLFLKNRGNI